MSRIQHVIAGMAAVLALSTGPAAAAGEILKGKALKAFFSGKTYGYYSTGGKKIATITYQPGGKIRSKLVRDGNTYSGKWFVLGGKYCTSYEYRPKVKCFKVRTTSSSNEFEDLAGNKVDGYFRR